MAALTLTDLFAVPALDRASQSALQQMLDGKAKPPGALGRIEELALTLGLIQQRLKPVVERPVLLVFAGDHGLTRSGVAAFPSSICCKADCDARSRAGTANRSVKINAAMPSLLQSRARSGRRRPGHRREDPGSDHGRAAAPSRRNRGGR